VVANDWENMRAHSLKLATADVVLDRFGAVGEVASDKGEAHTL
jgi:hypothetical protein